MREGYPMMKWIAPVGAALLLLVMTATPALAKKRKGPIEYGSWNVRVTPDAAAAAKGEKAAKDTLIMQQGVFRSETWYLYGFTSAGYTIHDKEFSVDTETSKYGKMHWSGLIDGDSIAGLMSWATKDGYVLSCSFAVPCSPRTVEFRMPPSCVF